MFKMVVPDIVKNIEINNTRQSTNENVTVSVAATEIKYANIAVYTNKSVCFHLDYTDNHIPIKRISG